MILYIGSNTSYVDVDGDDDGSKISSIKKLRHDEVSSNTEMVVNYNGRVKDVEPRPSTSGVNNFSKKKSSPKRYSSEFIDSLFDCEPKKRIKSAISSNKANSTKAPRSEERNSTDETPSSSPLHTQKLKSRVSEKPSNKRLNDTSSEVDRKKLRHSNSLQNIVGKLNSRVNNSSSLSKNKPHVDNAPSTPSKDLNNSTVLENSNTKSSHSENTTSNVNSAPSTPAQVNKQPSEALRGEIIQKVIKNFGLPLNNPSRSDRHVSNPNNGPSTSSAVQNKRKAETNKNDLFENDPVRQIKLLLLTLHDLNKLDYKISVLTTEALKKESSSLCDAVFYAQKENEAEGTLFTVRCADTENHKIGLQTLHRPDFHHKTSLYLPYLECLRKLTNERKALKSFVVYSNLKLDVDNFQKSNKIPVIMTGSNEYKIAVPQDASIFQSLKISSSENDEIAKELWKGYRDEKDVIFKSVFKKYHITLLLRRVLKIMDHKKPNKKIVKFCDEFINGPETDLKNYCLHYFKDKFKDARFVFSDKFGKLDFQQQRSHPFPLPVEPEDKKNITQFYKKLRFVQKTHVDDILQNKLGPDFILINNNNVKEIQMNLIKKLIQTDENVFETVKSTIVKTVTGAIDVEFEVDNLKSNLKLGESDKIILLKTKTVPIKKLKIEQVIGSTPGYSSDKLIFMNLNEISSLNEFDQFNLPTKKVLIIEIENEFKCKFTVKELQERLKEIKKTKDIIILGNTEIFTVAFQRDFCTKIYDTKKGMTDLTVPSQMKLFENRGINVSDKNVNYQDLMTIDSFLDFCETPDVFLELINSKEHLKIGQKILPHQKFVPRFLQREAVISNLIFHDDKLKDLFVIEGIGRTRFREVTRIKSTEKIVYYGKSKKRQNKIILFESNDIKFNFDDFCKNENNNVHLLKYSGGKFIWQKSNGSISNLVSYKVDKKSESSQKLNEIPSDKVVLISGDSGSGKTTYFQTFHQRFQTYENLLIWPEHVHVSNKDVKKLKQKKSKGETDSLILLKKLLHYKSPLQQELFSMCFNGKLKLKLFLFFDYLEDLDLDNLETVILLLKDLKLSSVEKIFVSISPNLQNKLEMKLDVFSYNLKSLTVEKKSKIIATHWSKNLNRQDARLKECADRLLKYFDSKNAHLTSNPQMLSMLAHVHQRKLEKNLENFIIEDIDDVYKLYTKFEESKNLSNNELYLIQKTSLTKLPKNSSDYVLFNMNLSSNHLKKNLPQDFKVSDELLNELNHITIVEYFAVQFLVNIIRCLPLKDKSLDNVQRNLLKNCCDLIDYLIKNSSPIFLSCLTNLLEGRNEEEENIYLDFLKSSASFGCSNIVEMLLKKLCKIKLSQNDLNKLEKSLLYSASKSGRLKIVQILLKRKQGENSIEHGEFKYNISKLSQFVKKEKHYKSPLVAAAENGHHEVAIELLLAGANIAELKNDFLENVTEFVASELSKVEPQERHKYHEIAEELFKIAPCAVANKSFDYPRLLNYFFVNARIEVLKILLKEEKKETAYRYFQPCNNKTPLDYINSSKLLKDDDRQYITKFFMEKIKFESEKDKVNTFRLFLEASIRHKHMGTFNYFFGSYPDGGPVGFLKYTIATRNFDAIKFLFKYHSELRNVALHVALDLKADFKMIKYIIEKAGVNNLNSDKENSLCHGLKKGAEIETIKYLIKKGADLNSEDESGVFAWCYAFTDQSSYTEDQQLILMNLFFHEVERKAREVSGAGKSHAFDLIKEQVEKNLSILKTKESKVQPLDFSVIDNI